MSTKVASQKTEPEAAASSQSKPPSEKESKTPHADKVAAMSEEELELNRRRFLAKQGFGEIPEEDLSPAAPDKKAEAEKPEVEPPPAAAQKPEEEVKPVESPEPGKDEEKKADAEVEGKEDGDKPVPAGEQPAPPKEIKFDHELATEIASKAAAEAAARTATEMTARQTPEPVPEQETEEEKLTPRQRKQLSVLREIQEGDPEYKDVPLVNQLKTFWQKEADYVAQWKKEHPGETFERSGDEHSQFYAEVLPSYSDDAYELAVERLQEKKIEQARREMRREVDELRHTQRLQAEVPRIAAVANAHMAELAGDVDPEIDKIVSKDGRRSLTHDDTLKIKEANPIAHRLLALNSEKLRLVVTELEAMTAFPDQVKFDPSKSVELPDGTVFLPHAEIDRFGTLLEQSLAKQPPEKTMRDGKRFVTQSQWMDEEQRIRKQHKDAKSARKAIQDQLESKCWVVDAPLFEQEYRKAMAEKIRKELNEWKSLVASSTTQSATQSTPSQPKPTPPKPQAEASKPKPPSVSSSSDRTNASGTSKAGAADSSALIDQRMWNL